MERVFRYSFPINLAQAYRDNEHSRAQANSPGSGSRTRNHYTLLHSAWRTRPMPRQYSTDTTQCASTPAGQEKDQARARSGQSLVEFALVGVILFSLLLGIID